jgi:CheY-like chemotaxis protein
MVTNQKFIYVVDDDPVICALLTDLIKFENLTCIIYKSWFELKKYLSSQNIADSDSGRILLIDLQMPDIDGLSAIKEFNSLYPESKIKIILMSANEDTEDLLIKSDLKINAIVKKPFNVINLQKTLAGFLNS